VSTVPAGSLANAAFTGANTVNGPALCSVSTRPAAFTAATSVVWSLEFTAFSTMFFDGNIGAPPTITVFSPLILSCAVTGAMTAVVMNSAPNTAAGNNRPLRFDMDRLPKGWIAPAAIPPACWSRQRSCSQPDARSMAELRGPKTVVSVENSL
jgi:hypothetical protein